MTNIIQANTFTPLYDEVEDRIRLVLNYQDISNRIDLMITRSFIINLISSVDDFVFQHYGDISPKLDNITIDQTSPKTKHTEQTDQTNLQLYYEKDQLLTKLDLKYDQDTKHTTIVFTTKDSVSAATMDATMLQALFDSIKKAIPNFKWGISLWH
jgi:hypothetical protein